MIIVLNGYPGVGKLAVGRELAALLNGRLLDIHTVYNVAFALTTFKTPEFRDAVERIEAVAYDLVLKLPTGQPVVFTTVIAGSSEWGDSEWQKFVEMGAARPPFYVIHLRCSLEENVRRIQSEERSAKGKPRDPEFAYRNQGEAEPLAGLDSPNLLELDTTELSPKQAAEAISSWLNSL